MDCAKSIDELYDEVKDCNLVITNDAALATALNGRVDRPIVGPFAVTPKMVAGMVGPDILSRTPYRDLKVITTVAEETGLDFRYVHSEIENIKEIRKHTASVENYLYTEKSKSIWESYKEIPTQMQVMGRYNVMEHPFFDSFKKIAVIGLDLFNDLDKHFLPLSFDIVDMFKKKNKEDKEYIQYEIDTIYEIGNDRQVAENAVDLIVPEDAQDYAIVLNSDSPLTDAVRSALYRRSIPFVNSLTVKDLTQIRDYLQFLTMSLSFKTLRVRHVRELLMSYNGYIKPNKDGILLYKILEDDISDHTRELLELMRDIQDSTFKHVIDVIGNPGSTQVRMLLDDMNLKDQLVDPEKVSRLVYAVNNVSDLRHNEEIPEYERAGVLITDCKKSVYVDRPVVIYLGMEQDWNIPVVGKKYLDAETETENNTTRLKVLLQQGSKRIYCVNTSKNGRQARPCLTFDNIIGDSAKSFKVLCRNLVRGRWSETERQFVFDRGETGLEPGQEFNARFSKSSFDSYIDCPRKFMYDVLIPSPDEKHTEFGSLIHEFAELYVCYPDMIRRDGVEKYVNLVSDKYAGLSSSMMEEIDTDRIRLAMVNIMRFVDMRKISGVPLDTDNSSRKYPNRFMQILGLDRTSSKCETEQSPRDIPIHGFFDVYTDGIISDYKTGKAFDGKTLVNRMCLDSKEDYIDFQPLFYLAMAAEDPRSVGRFDLVYLMDKDVSALDPGFDISQNIRTIRLCPGSLEDVIRDSNELRVWLDTNLSSKFKGKSEQILDALLDCGAKEPGDLKDNRAFFVNMMTIAGFKKESDSATKTVNSAINKIMGRFIGNMVSTDTSVEVPQATLDAFLTVVREKHAAAMEGSRTVLHADPRKDCSKCQYFYACTAEVIKIEEAVE